VDDLRFTASRVAQNRILEIRVQRRDETGDAAETGTPETAPETGEEA